MLLPRWMTKLIASNSTACVALFLLTFLVTSVPETMRWSFAGGGACVPYGHEDLMSAPRLGTAWTSNRDGASVAASPQQLSKPN